jgi:DNA-binding LytR/AlgR family response regulator
MKLSCYLLDDEYHAIELLKDFVERTPGLELKGFSTSPAVALEEIAGGTPPAILFLDVDMPEMSGMELAPLVSLYTKVIFTTSYREYALEAFEKDAFDYLLKPVSFDRFQKAVFKVRKYFAEREQGRRDPKDYFYVKTEVRGKLVRIVIDDIIYIEAAQNYLIINSRSGKHMAYLTMDEIAERLKLHPFIRVHRSYIIHQERIKLLEHGQVTLEEQTVIPLGRQYKEPLLKTMNVLLLQSRRNSS